jgi:hypothetical protein
MFNGVPLADIGLGPKFVVNGGGNGPCGGSCGDQSNNSNSTPPAISVSVIPSATTTLSGATTTFTATVANTSDQTVTWSATLGVIDASSGAYIAPTAFATTTDTVTARSNADNTKTDTATVTINPVPVTISISPTSTSVMSDGSISFNATVTNGSTSTVNWSAALGTINASGTYTAPTLSSSTFSATDTVTAVSVADNTKVATATVSITNALTDWWKLDEGTGTVAIDSMNSAHNGNWHGTEAGTAGYYGAARPSSTLAFSGIFDGTNDYIDPSLTVDYTTTSSFTWSIWMDLSSSIQPDNVILGDRLNPLWVKLTPTAFEYYNGALIHNTIPTGQWAYIAVVKSGTSFYYYQNGTLEGSASSTDVPGDLNFFIGTDPNSNGDGYTWGSLSDVRIYSTALSQAQVQAIYNGN